MAQELYHKYQLEMWEIISSYGFTNEIDLFCCMESRRMNANERSDTQQTIQVLLREVFGYIRRQFHENVQSFAESKSKAAACYYVAYTDTSAKNKQMLSFPWLFASQLLPHCDVEMNDYMQEEIDDHSPLYQWLQREDPLVLGDFLDRYVLTLTDVFELYFKLACDQKDGQMITLAEGLIKQLIAVSKTTDTN